MEFFEITFICPSLATYPSGPCGARPGVEHQPLGFPLQREEGAERRLAEGTVDIVEIVLQDCGDIGRAKADVLDSGDDIGPGRGPRVRKP
jgi:hypothetical protein